MSMLILKIYANKYAINHANNHISNYFHEIALILMLTIALILKLKGLLISVICIFNILSFHYYSFDTMHSKA